jgi:thiosulfate/3-mercaptopyruvate sulfurtransferase
MRGLPVQAGALECSPANFSVTSERDLLALWPQVLEASRGEASQVIDARTPGRFAGTEQDRYPGTRAGHIPNSLNLYWADLLEAESRTLLPVAELRERFDKAGILWDKPVTATCGSGLTACILALGLHLCGKDDWRVYDGSWDEWGRRQDLPVQP